MWQQQQYEVNSFFWDKNSCLHNFQCYDYIHSNGTLKRKEFAELCSICSIWKGPNVFPLNTHYHTIYTSICYIHRYSIAYRYPIFACKSRVQFFKYTLESGKHLYFSFRVNPSWFQQSAHTSHKDSSGMKIVAGKGVIHHGEIFLPPG